MFQEPTLDGYLSAEQNLRFHGELYGVDRITAAARRKEVLDMVGLYERRNDLVQTFSGGMRRRLEIARGLLHSPKVLFLDEPTIGLDPQTRASIWQYINELHKREEITVFVTTHYMDEAENCDRIAIIDQGKIVALDTPAALKAAIGKDRVQIATADDAAASPRCNRIFGLEAHDGRRAGDVRVAEGAQFVPQLFDEARRRDPLGGRAPAEPRRRVPRPHRHLAARCRGEGVQIQSNGRSARRKELIMAQASMASIARSVFPRAGSGTNCARWLVVWEREMIRFTRDPARVVSSIVQPLLFLFVLGSGLGSLMQAGTGGVDFKTFLFPGVLSMSVLFTAAFCRDLDGVGPRVRVPARDAGGAGLDHGDPARASASAARRSRPSSRWWSSRSRGWSACPTIR